MNKKQGKASLYSKLLIMTLVPLFLLAVVIMSFSAHRFAEALHEEVKKGLQDLNATFLTMYDYLYPGEYTAVEMENEIYMLKGEHQINGDFSLIDRMKESTGVDITLFYQDARVITTLRDQSGNRIIGTMVNSVVKRDVIEKEIATFYPSVNINGTEYFAYYEPIKNSDGSMIGMLFVGKPAKEVYQSVRSSVMPIIVIGLIAMMLAGFVTLRFTKELISGIKKIELFLKKVAKGNLRDELDYEVLKRDDELGEMGKNAVHMQKALIEQVEKDALTGLYNRRYSEKKMEEIYKKGIPFSLVLCDIDFFKKVNDTYGHECGDLVLQEVATILKRNMRGKGYAARWGGEEFLLVFEDYKKEQAVMVLQGIMEDVRNIRIEYKEEIVTVTMTFGVCEGTSEDLDVLLKEADDKLYYGKENGRNQIVE